MVYQPPKNREEMTRRAWYRFYGLIAAVGVLTVIALISFTQMPILQDPATGRLPEVAARTMIFFVLAFIASGTVIVLFTNKRR